MKFLKVAVNSLVTGLFFSSLLSFLISDININIVFNLRFFGELTLFLFITYGLLISFLTFLLFFVTQFFSGKKFKIATLSPSFLCLSFSFALVLFLLIFRGNIKHFFTLFDTQAKKNFNFQFFLFLIAVFLGVLSFYSFYRYRKKVAFFLIYFLLIIGGLNLLFLQRLHSFWLPLPKKTAFIEAKNVNRKMIIIGLEGLSFDFLIPLSNAGKLPNFSWFMDNGSWGKLESFTPNETLPLLTSFNTGKYPAKHRRLSLYKYHLLGVSKAIEITPRFIFFRQWSKMGLIRITPHNPPLTTVDFWKILKDNKISFIKKDWPYELTVTNPSPKAEKMFNTLFQELKFAPPHLATIVKQSFYHDFVYEEEINQERNKSHPQIIYFFLNGLNMVESFFYKYNFPDLFGNIAQEDINKYSPVIEKYYQYYDQIIGKYLASLKEDEILIVFSPHGIEALPLWKRFIELILGKSQVSAYHEQAPEGVIFFYGREINRGKNIEGMKIIDLTPTFLNYLGLPVGKDMDGIVNNSIFVEEFKRENPVLYISSYQEISIKNPQ